MSLRFTASGEVRAGESGAVSGANSMTDHDDARLRQIIRRRDEPAVHRER
ncbi:hypothetical protein [Rothia nasimurium]|nr:hypothetical protein [Rothia nasimurium]